MDSTQTAASGGALSEKKRLKLEKFANKIQKQALEAQYAQKQPYQPTSASTRINGKGQKVFVSSSSDWIEETPSGKKKILKALDDGFHSAYLPKVVESGWYSFWEDTGLFKPETKNNNGINTKGKYVIAMPPPNVRNQTFVDQSSIS